MNNAAAWRVPGVGPETREIAEVAARRAGMSLGDWLDEVVAEQAADQGVSADDWDADEKVDAIDERLSRVSRHERVAAAVRRDGGEERQALRPEQKRPAEEARRAQDQLEATTDDRADENKLGAIGDRLARLWSRDRATGTHRPTVGKEMPTPRPEPKLPAEEARRAQEPLEAAVAKFESRAAKIEERTARALESVASWIEQSQGDRAEESATLRSVAQRLAALELRWFRGSPTC